MSEHDVLVFLLSLATLLALARALGELARHLGLPLIVGELSAGILLGPTVLGRALPDVRSWLFPSGTPQKMLGAYTTVAVVLLLVVAGIEVDLSIVRRRGRSALLTSVLGILLPMGGGLLLGLLLPDSDLVHPEHRNLFALFIGVALSISALPVIAKTLLDLGLFKTDIGLLVMAAAMIDDLIGWLSFSVLLGPMRGGTLDLRSLAITLVLTIGFVTLCIFVGRRATDRLFGQLENAPVGAPGRVLSIVILLALFGASITQAVGIHAVFGGFVVGVMVGDSPRLKQRTRVVIEDFVMNIFAPVFFASLGLRVDFVKAFDLRLCALVFLIATMAKVIGCTIGARAGGMQWRQSAAIGFGLNARGAKEIILALLAGVKRDAREAVIERERVASTGLGDEVAIPHAAVEGLEQPLLALGLAQNGIDFDAPDGKPAKIVFLLLMPPKQYDREVRVLASIARAVFDDRARIAVLRAETVTEATDALTRNAQRVKESSRPTTASLADL